LYVTWVKSLSEAHPDLGVAKDPVDVHLYVDGREQARGAVAAGAAAADEASRPPKTVSKSLILAVIDSVHEAVHEGRKMQESKWSISKPTSLNDVSSRSFYFTGIDQSYLPKC
jgi:hypothetical protein